MAKKAKRKSKNRSSTKVEAVEKGAADTVEPTAAATADSTQDAPTESGRKQAKKAVKAEKAEKKKLEKAAKKVARKAAKDAAKASAKQSAKGESSSPGEAPRFKHVRSKRLASGKGPTPREIGESLVALFNAGKAEEAERTWYHRRIESIEADGTVFEGAKGVAEKGEWWRANFTVISMRATELYTCSTGFSVVYKGRIKGPDGVERESSETGVYTVEKGRIVREQFMG